MIPQVAVDVTDALKKLTSMITGFGKWNRIQATVGTNVHYGVYVHMGHRRYKGNPFLTNALEKNLPNITPLLTSAAEQVANGAPENVLISAFQNAGYKVQADAQRMVNVKTGNLRRSIHTVVTS